MDLCPLDQDSYISSEGNSSELFFIIFIFRNYLNVYIQKIRCLISVKKFTIAAFHYKPSAKCEKRVQPYMWQSKNVYALWSIHCVCLFFSIFYVVFAVLEYQNEDSKRNIIRFEQCARSSMQRTLASKGALAVLYGNHIKKYIKKTEVCFLDFKVLIQIHATPMQTCCNFFLPCR